MTRQMLLRLSLLSLLLALTSCASEESLQEAISGQRAIKRQLWSLHDLACRQQAQQDLFMYRVEARQCQQDGRKHYRRCMLNANLHWKQVRLLHEEECP